MRVSVPGTDSIREFIGGRLIDVTDGNVWSKPTALHPLTQACHQPQFIRLVRTATRHFQQ